MKMPFVLGQDSCSLGGAIWASGLVSLPKISVGLFRRITDPPMLEVSHGDGRCILRPFFFPGSNPEVGRNGLFLHPSYLVPNKFNGISPSFRLLWLMEMYIRAGIRVFCLG